MSHYLVELYSPNSAWRALSVAQRQQFLSQIQTAMGALANLGVEVLTLSKAELLADKPSQHQFLGIWRFPNKDARDMLLAGIKASGWYDYFEHINAAGEGSDFANHLADLTAG